MAPELFQSQVLCWFDQYGRKNLPWQQPITPYRVWVSEIMLQQTQVSTVIDYFNRFIARFPDLAGLANAPQDDVLAHWAGLGYYSRARNLHKTAQLALAHYGDLPDSLDALMALPGIGRSTAGAILSIAFGQSQPILDGNVKRVLARFQAISEWTGSSAVTAQLWELSTRYTPAQRTADYTQAMMDLGATLCTRSRPQCPRCPLQSHCRAYLQTQTHLIPAPKPRKTLPVKAACFLILENPAHEILLIKRPPTGIWGGLWCLPQFDSPAELNDWCLAQGYSDTAELRYATLRHTFSHYHLDYSTYRLRLNNHPNRVMEDNSAVWYNRELIKTVGLPTPVRRLLNNEDSNGTNSSVFEIGD